MSVSPAAIESSVSALGCSGSSGMSATNSPIAVRRSALRYGARNPSRTASSGRSSDSCERATDERGGRRGDRPQHRPRPDEADHAGRRGTCGLVHGGVHEHHTAQPVAVALRPSERDRSAPVVRDRDHRSGDIERSCDGVEVVDATGEASQRSRALGEPHVEVVDGNDPDVGRSRARGTRGTGTTTTGCRERTAVSGGGRRHRSSCRARATCAGRRRRRPRRRGATSPGRDRPTLTVGAAPVRCGSPAQFDDAGVEAGADAHAHDRVADGERVLHVGERDRDRSRADVAVERERLGDGRRLRG